MAFRPDIEQYMGADQIPWRALRRLAPEKVGGVQHVIYTAGVDRTEKQLRSVREALSLVGKDDRRQKNVQIAQGRVHTSHGMGYAKNGTVKRSK